jgi:short-subunit dehydrogenase
VNDRERYGPWALILGASEGIGVSFARLLGERGINSVLVARNAALLEEVAADIRSATGVETRTLALDLTRPDMLERIREVTDELDVGLVIFNAAAVPGGGGLFLESRFEDAEHTLRLVVFGAAKVCHHFGAKLVARRRGGIVLMGSLSGNAGGARLAAYSGAKAFTQMFAEALWAELQPSGVDVLCYVVGATATPSRARLNLTDQPGDIVADPDDIARLALENLPNGPVQAPPHLQETFHALTRLDRREAAESMSHQLGAYHVGDGEPAV